MVQLAPLATEPPQVLACENWVAGRPMLEMSSVTDPVLV
jgi:hypothetical protein